MRVMNQTAQSFYKIGEPYAAGLFEEPERSCFYRHCLGYARYFEHLAPASYEAGERLYPCGNKFWGTNAVMPHFVLTYSINWEKLQKKQADENSVAKLREFWEVSHNPWGWTHGAPNFKRIVKEGLSSYRTRVKMRPADTREEKDFREGLLALLSGMENYIERSVQYLREVGAPEELVGALAKVPFKAADSYYEGLVSWNMIAYFDGMDNLGCLDDGLSHLYRGEDLTDVIGQLFENINQVGNWSCTIGCSGYNAVTEQAMRAIHGKRRPMLELMVREDMPDQLWEIALKNIKDGCTNPSFYNTKGIHAMLHDRFPHIPEEELQLFCGCGCTETNLQGISRVGGTDLDIRLHVLFLEYMREKLAECADFDSFYEGLCSKIRKHVNKKLDEIGECYMYRAKYLPQPMRTLLFDDCIAKGKDFYAGGTRYSWTMSSHSGMINVIDSLLAVRELIYRKKQFTVKEFIDCLEAEDEAFLRILKTCLCYGVDDPDADELAADFAGRMYRIYREKPPYEFIDAFTLTDHQFLRYEEAGRDVGPTPDGRRGGMPTCDSVGPLRGKAIEGPTAVLKSAARLPQHLVDGIAVLNLTVQKSFPDNVLRALIEGYMNLGGMQVQMTCTDIEELQDAMMHPEKHEDLIVRVGGYSEYFNRLSPELKKSVLERNIHAL